MCIFCMASYYQILSYSNQMKSQDMTLNMLRIKFHKNRLVLKALCKRDSGTIEEKRRRRKIRPQTSMIN